MFSHKRSVPTFTFGVLLAVLCVVCAGKAQTAPTFSVTTGGITELEIAGPSPWIDVTAPLYGADPTGTSDSTNQINNAIAACNGGTVFLPPGTYKHTGQLLGSTPCTVMGLGPADGAGASIILKSYSSTGGFPGANGSFLISANNFTLQNVEYNGNGGTYTGPCITDAAENSHVIIQYDYLYNCAGDTLNFTAAASGDQGPTDIKVWRNHVVTASTSNIYALQMQESITDIDIEGNTFDCSASNANSSPGSACLQIESDGLTTQFEQVRIRDNKILTPGCPSTGLCWGIQMGNFNAYNPQDVQIGPNTILLTSANAGCGSLSWLVNASVNLGVCDAQGNNVSYTMWEIIDGTGDQYGPGVILGENIGQGNAMTVNSQASSTFQGITINGFGESGVGGTTPTAGIELDAGWAGQAIASCSESGNVATYTTSIAMNGALQPGLSVYLAGGFTPSGYGGGPYMVLTTNYSRSSKSFSVALPISGLASCTAEGTVNSVTSNNTFSGITINMPTGVYGGLASTLYGIQIRCVETGCYTSNNNFSGITINGTPGATITEDGIDFAGTGAASDSNVVQGVSLNNLTNGILSVTGTNNSIIYPKFASVGTHLNGSTGLVLVYTPPNGTPSITGCGVVGSQAGNGFAGSFTAGQAACVAAITPGETAPNGWLCTAYDFTHTADLFVQTVKSTTACTVSGTVTSGDVIQFSATPY
jgi:hypothetical protein